jgi:hypothetical protein
MQYKTKKYRIFGPKHNMRPPSFRGVHRQSGDGFGSMFAKMGRVLGKTILPKAANVIKKVASNQSVKDIGNLLLDKGVEAAAEITGYFCKILVFYSIIFD